MPPTDARRRAPPAPPRRPVRRRPRPLRPDGVAGVRGPRRGAHAVTLHGTDLAHPRSRAITRPRCRFSTSSPRCPSRWRRPDTARAVRGRTARCSPSASTLERFRPIPRDEAPGRSSASAPDEPYLLFPADPRRPEKRYDRALAVAGGVPTAHARRRRPEQRPVVRQRRERGARPVRARGVRAGGARGARMRRARAGHARRDRAGSPRRRSTGPTCGPFDEAAWAPRSHRTSTRTIPRINGRDRAERSRPTGWRPRSSPHGGRCV